MRFRKIIKLFEDGNVCVCGLRGRGKDMLMANVIMRRKLPYVSNIDYGGEYNPFKYADLDCGKNTYKNFIDGNLKKYVYPYEDKTDIYLSDAGIYFPAQFNNELDRQYLHMAVFQAISRHVGQCNFHWNAQSLSRVYLKIREQSDVYILCRRCIYLFGFVIQKVTIYDRYESAVNRQKPLVLPLPLFAGKELRMMRKTEQARFEAMHGEIRDGWLLYRNKSHYDTRRFKKLLEEGIE